MANTELFGLWQPRTDLGVAASGEPEAPVLIAATASATAAPDGDSGYIQTREVDVIRLFVEYAGSVTSATVALWVLQDGTWYWGDTHELTPANGNEFRDVSILGRHTRFTVQLSEISGGGTAEIRVMGIL